MKRRNFVKLTAMATAAVMAISPAMVFAAEGESDDGATTAGSTINGSGTLEDYVDKEVFKVVLPTNANADFKLDPQGLLKIADSTNYTLGAGAIYFGNKTGTSDAIEIVNKSSYDISVDFSVKVTLPEGVKMVATEAALTSATEPSIYLAMQKGSDTAIALKEGSNKAARAKADKVAEDTDASHTKADATGYIVTATGDATNGYTYKYELGNAFTAAAGNKVSYTLSGKCDSTADWSKLKDANVTTEIIWSAKKWKDTPDAYGTWDGSTLWLSVDAENGFDTVSKVEVSGDGVNGTYKALATDKYTSAESGWVSVDWNDISTLLGEGLTGTVCVKVTDKNGSYIFENK